MRYILPLLILAGSAAKADDPVARKETYTEAVQRHDATLAGMNETVGNYNAELGCVKEELKGLKQEVAALKKMLTTDTTIRVPEPPAEPTLAPPVKADAPPKDADRHTAGPTLRGKPLDVAAVIKANYRKRWTHPGTIDSHLAEHGVAGFEGLDGETKEKLHSALHEMGESPAKAVTKSRVVVKAPVVLPSSGGCPNGQCPNARMYGYSTTRSRLFGWRR